MKRWSDKQMERWEKVRSAGKWFFVGKTAIKFSLGFVLFTLLFDWLSDDIVSIKSTTILLSVVTGVAVGLVAWWQNDAAYQDQILDEKIETRLQTGN
jgi:hypothetical protein